MIKALDDAMKAVSEDPQFKADMAKISYRELSQLRGGKEFIYKKRDSLQGLIDSAPSLDDLVM